LHLYPSRLFLFNKNSQAFLLILTTLRYLLASTRNKSGKNRGGERGEEKREEGEMSVLREVM